MQKCNQPFRENRVIFSSFLSVAMLFFVLGYNDVLAKGDLFVLGKEAAKKMINAKWMDLGKNCIHADKLFEFSVKRKKQANKVDKRYYEGYVSGFVRTFDTISEHCAAKCSQDGKAVGKETAYLYCDLSEMIGRQAVFAGKTDIENTFCGEPYSMGCESAFYTTARQKCPQYAHGFAFNKFFQAVYRGACSYPPD